MPSISELYLTLSLIRSLSPQYRVNNKIRQQFFLLFDFKKKNPVGYKTYGLLLVTHQLYYFIPTPSTKHTTLFIYSNPSYKLYFTSLID